MKVKYKIRIITAFISDILPYLLSDCLVGPKGRIIKANLS